MPGKIKQVGLTAPVLYGMDNWVILEDWSNPLNTVNRVVLRAEVATCVLVLTPFVAI